MNRKAQFYIIGVVLLTGLILGLVVIQGGGLVSSSSVPSSRLVFEQSMDEFARSVGIAVEKERTTDRLERTLKSYMNYIRHVETLHALDSRSYFLAGIPTETGYNVTVGNYWKRDIDTMWIQMDDELQQLQDLSDTEIRSVEFGVTESPVTVTANFSDQEVEFDTQRNVFSMIHSRASTGANIWQDTRIQ